MVDNYGLKKSPIVGENIRQLGGSKIGAPPGVGTLGSLGEKHASEAGKGKVPVSSGWWRYRWFRISRVDPRQRERKIHLRRLRWKTWTWWKSWFGRSFFLFQGCILRFHINLPGCTLMYQRGKKTFLYAVNMSAWFWWYYVSWYMHKCSNIRWICSVLYYNILSFLYIIYKFGSVFILFGKVRFVPHILCNLGVVKAELGSFPIDLWSTFEEGKVSAMKSCSIVPRLRIK